MTMASDSGFVILRARPNPDAVCRFSGLSDEAPRLWVGPMTESEAHDGAGEAGVRQGAGRFIWESVPLPACWTEPPLRTGSGEWRLMFHLWRPQETGLLQCRVYLVRTMSDLRERQWRYYLWWPDVALGTTPKARDFMLPVNLNACLRPLLLTTHVHAHRPQFAFDLRLHAGPPIVYAIKASEQDIEARVMVQRGDAVLFDRTAGLRDLSIGCDLEPCISLDEGVSSTGDRLLITGDVDTGPWSGTIRISEEHMHIRVA